PPVLPLHDPLAHLVVDLEELEDAHAPAEPAASALLAALAAERAGFGKRIRAGPEHALLPQQLDGVLVVGPRAQELHGRLVEALALTAADADPAGQALRDDEDEGGGEQKRLHAHVEEPGHGGGGVVGVPGGEEEPAHESGSPAGPPRLPIAAITDQ